MINKTHTGEVRGPQWMEWLGHLANKPDVRGLEIGTFEGESAEWMLDNIFTDPHSTYTCVDHFQGNVEHPESGVDIASLEQKTKARLVRFKNVIIHKGSSDDVLVNLSKRSYDFVYVDASHDAMNTLRDSVLAFEILKPGGVMIWDDYEWAVLSSPLDRPKMAIDAFLSVYSREIKILEPMGWQVAVKKV